VLFPFDPSTVMIEPGEAIQLAPRTIMSLSLVLHELATNAAKYGALSQPGGVVRVRWRAVDGERLRLNWVERGGPTVSAPTSIGYGTRLIRSTATYSLGGTVELKLCPDGLEAEIAIPLGSACVLLDGPKIGEDSFDQKAIDVDVLGWFAAIAPRLAIHYR